MFFLDVPHKNTPVTAEHQRCHKKSKQNVADGHFSVPLSCYVQRISAYKISWKLLPQHAWPVTAKIIGQMFEIVGKK